MSSQRKTRRSSRQVVLDELDLVMRRLEQIKNMVDKHCVAPLKEPSVRSQIVAHLQSKAEAQAQTQAQPKPLTPIQEEEEGLSSAPASAALAAEADIVPEEEAEPEPSKLALAVEPAPAIKKKSGGCPGGPKAYNEFVKKWLAEQRAAGREMTYQQALKEIKEKDIYTQSCGLPPKKNKTRKLPKVSQTPGRVNAPYVPYVQNSPNAAPAPVTAAPSSLSAAASLASAPQVKERGKSLPPTAANLEKQESERKYLEEGIASRRAAREAEAEALAPVAEEEGSSLAAPEGYEDLGMNDNLGMRKISVNGRKLLMTNGNSGLFEDKEGAPGDFIGYLKDGKVVPSSPPEL